MKPTENIYIRIDGMRTRIAIKAAAMTISDEDDMG